MLRIGRLQLATDLLLAPIAGYCDLAFRLTVRPCSGRCGLGGESLPGAGVGLAFTDLLCPHGVLRQNARTRWLMATCADDWPLGMQLYGNDPPLLAEAARWSVDHGAALIDLNMGCPVDKVTRTFAGAMMLRTPEAAMRVVEAVIAAVGEQVPVTVKTRLGYERGERTAPALGRRMVEAGIAGLTIHGRTAAQRFKGTVDLDGIAEVVDAVHDVGLGKVPCIGNGDVRTPFDAQRMIERTGCDGVMIGRAALEAPWIFPHTHRLLTTGAIGDEPTLRQRLDVIRQHFAHLRRLRDDRLALHLMRQRIAGYGKHLGPCQALKHAIGTLDRAEAFDAIFDRHLADNPTEADAVPLTWRQRALQLAGRSPAPTGV